ncbi:hypothetical protein AAC387_Pa05g3044 [Persea americana]
MAARMQRYMSSEHVFSSTQALMAIILISLLFISVFSISTTQPQQFNITLNSSLTPTNNTAWLSPSGRFSFGFYPQGNGFAVGVWLAGSSENRIVVWTANRDNQPVSDDAILLLTREGSLLLRSRGQDTLISNARAAASSASMLDTGNFVLYTSRFQIIWQTFDSPTDTLLAGQSLLTGRELFSGATETNHSTGRFRLKMQTDGNLVLYPFNTMDIAGESIWSTATQTQGNNVTLHLNNNGQIFMLNSSGYYIKNITDSLSSINQAATVIIYRAILDFGGIFRLYSHSFDRNGNSTMIEEWPKTSRYCEVKGFCGINSYCTQNDSQADCSCPRGFDFVDPGKRFHGCVKNFIEEGCRGKKENMTYGIDSIKNTLWENNPYSSPIVASEQECRDACLQDCNCEAAFFKERVCQKQKLPLRYGKRNLDDSTTSLIKFGIGNWASPDDKPKPMPPTQDSGSEKEQNKEIFVTGIALMACSLVITAISGFLIYRQRIRTYRLISEITHKRVDDMDEFSPRPFSYDELEKATNGFKEELGKGSFGTVYRGALSNGAQIVAVKRLDGVVEEGEREFHTEMNAIGRTHHRNLVRLLGFCADGPHRLLVYEYMSNGSLADLLFSPERRPNWNDRVRIAMDIARGIIYLHEDCETPIIHCDIKPQNILMDEFYRAKISDFGLAKLMKPDQTRTFTGVRGTRGYVAPEWHRNMPLTVKADVYSFGIMLLEIICCRRNVETKAEEKEKILSYWVHDCFELGDIGKLVNYEEVDERRLEEMVKVGLWCIQDKPSLRPSMKNVLMMFESTIEIPTPPTSFLCSP